MFKKIISGGQTGVDQAALKTALQLGIKIGGWCPPGRVCEEGNIPDEFTLKETPVERSEQAMHIPRSLRTEWNVRDADASLVLLAGEDMDSGTAWTIQSAKNSNKPCLVLNITTHSEIPFILSWITKNRVETLNIAGPSESSFPGINNLASCFLSVLFKRLKQA
ncbi:MAG TPA: molybdenum cofactor carrier [Bacteroidales bacterium]|jgi:predicted Rossmann-fold nucleotide-binding protein|nr:molybdenum cofactor carrier [Bacteroidales bacterium]